MGTKVIWDGKDLPPVGCEVLVKLASVKGKVIHIVTGYKVYHAFDAKHPWQFSVIIELEANGIANQRSLNEVFPLDHRD